MDNECSITITDRLLKSEDFKGKKKILEKYIEKLDANDTKLFNKINDVIYDEDQQGKVVEIMQEETEKLKKNNKNILEELDRKISTAVMSLNDHVDGMKEQEFTITYQERIPADPNAF
jgi:hypothetical protein